MMIYHPLMHPIVAQWTVFRDTGGEDAGSILAPSVQLLVVLDYSIGVACLNKLAICKRKPAVTPARVR